MEVEAADTPPAIAMMRAATGEAHRRLEDRLAAVAQLSHPERRADLLQRYAALHIPARAALAAELDGVPDLDFPDRCRASLLSPFVGRKPLPPFPRPASRAEALGLLYVLEGSTLGGRHILRALAEQGIDDPELAFLDPYGHATGVRWRGFLSVLERETAGDADRIREATRGAVRGFDHAEQVLCEEEP